MHISLQLAVKEKTWKVPPTKPLEGEGGGIQKEWGCVEISRKTLSHGSIHNCFTTCTSVRPCCWRSTLIRAWLIVITTLLR